MASSDISRFHGRVTKCDCGLADNPSRDSLRVCAFCFGRAFVAECLHCDGKGQIEEKVAGSAAGTMKSTCNACGGIGKFAVNRPADWVDPVPETTVQEEQQTTAA